MGIGLVLAVFLASGATVVLAESDLDDLPQYEMDAYAPPIEAEVAAFDLAGPAERPYCLAVSGKSVFLLKSSGKNWRTLDVIQPGGVSVGGGFLEVPGDPIRRFRDAPFRFFVNSVDPAGRIQAEFYVSAKGVTRVDGRTTGRLYRREGPVLFSQKVADAAPILVEIGIPGGLPKSIGRLALPEGTHLFGFARASDADAGEIVRFAGDRIELWIKDRPAARASFEDGRLFGPHAAGSELVPRPVPPAVLVDAAGSRFLAVAVNNPDLSGGFFRREKNLCRLAIFRITRTSDSAALDLVGATPLMEGSVSDMTASGGDAVIAVVDAASRRTRLYRLGPSALRKEGSRQIRLSPEQARKD